MNRRDLIEMAGGLVGSFALPQPFLEYTSISKLSVKASVEWLDDLIGKYCELLDEDGNKLFDVTELTNTKGMLEIGDYPIGTSPFSAIDQTAIWELGYETLLIKPVAVAIYRPDMSLVRVAKLSNPQQTKLYKGDTITIQTKAILH